MHKEYARSRLMPHLSHLVLLWPWTCYLHFPIFEMGVVNIAPVLQQNEMNKMNAYLFVKNFSNVEKYHQAVLGRQCYFFKYLKKNNHTKSPNQKLIKHVPFLIFIFYIYCIKCNFTLLDTEQSAVLDKSVMKTNIYCLWAVC